jgi:hypothetical protein
VTASIGVPNVTEATDDLLLEKVSIPKLQSPPAPFPFLCERLSEGTTGPLTVVRGPSAAGRVVWCGAGWCRPVLPYRPVAVAGLPARPRQR